MGAARGQGGALSGGSGTSFLKIISPRLFSSLTVEESMDARYLNRRKQMSPNIAMEMYVEESIHVVEGRTVSCDGGGGALGHPKVFINLDKHKLGQCAYCSRLHVKKEHLKEL